MTDYLLLIPSDEAAWDAVPQAERDATYAKHMAFGEALAARGHQVKAGAELQPSAQARVVRGAPGAVSVTTGPYAESAEQLSGFYLISSDDLDDLLDCVAILADGEGALELRATTGGMA
ncbi:YciI family protein [Nocardioides psychrotolerans]|uniref:YciI family protein n=1 Tax=Nocardioides psychrotolerans TaxID=1005945 RepID=UPI003137941D